MKIETNKVFVKRGRESTAISAQDVTIDGVTLGAMLTKLNNLKSAYESLTEALKECHILKKDTDYIINIENELKVVDNLEVFEVKALKYPLKFYTVKNGDIVIDKKKVGAL